MEKITEWKELSREIAFQKYSRKIEKVMFKMPDQSEKDFYIKREGPAASILAFTKEGKIILVKQFRPGPKKIFYELPGGYVENAETAIASAERELLEETGYKGELKLIGTCFDDAYSTMERYCFVAKSCEKVVNQSLEDTEFAEVILKDIPSFRKLLRSGEMTDVEVGYLGLDYLELL